MPAGRFGKMGLAAMIITLIIITINTSAAPLEVSIEEKVNSTIDTSDVGNDGKPVFQVSTNVTGAINVTNNADEDIMDIWVAVDLENATDTGCQGTYVVSSVPDKIVNDGGFDTTNANCFIHIPLLKAGESVVAATYDVNESGMTIENGAPFIVDERYDPAKIPKGGDYTWTVYFNVTLNDTWWSNTAVGTPGSVTLTVTKNLNTSYDNSNWKTLEFADGSSNPKTIIDSLSVSSTTWQNVTFQVKGNYSTSEAFTSKLVGFGEAVISFDSISGNISGTKIVDVFAIGNASIAVNKSGPDSNYNWTANATITNTVSGSLSYNLTSITVYATTTGSFSNYVTDPEWTCDEQTKSGNVICKFTPNVELNSTNPSYKTGDIVFTYDQVPVIWANATFKLVNGENGWDVGQAKIEDGGNTYVIEKIYVIGSYLIKVTKHVQANASAGDNVFDVKLVVENLGGQESPYVYVYDMIPTNFNEYNWNDDWQDARTDGNWIDKGEMYAGNGTGTPMNGYSKAYYWRLNPLAGGANGDGQDDTTEINSNQSVVIFYQINGSGDYRLLDAFIVGIDPMLSMNEQTSPKITVVSGAKATSYESVMALATAFVGLAAVVSYRKRS